MASTSRLLTQRERILLLLYEEDYDPEDYLAPFIVCQDGISDALDILKNNVSREINKLKDEGLVREELARVKGFERRRNVYFPTEKGKEVAEELINELRETEIKIRDDKTTTLNLEEAIEKLSENHPNVNIFHLEEWMRKRDVLDIEEFSLPDFVEKGGKKEKVEMVVTSPSIEEFYGRDEELEEISQLLLDDNPPFVVISGMAGIGKSSLGTKLMNEIKGEKGLLWYNFHDWDTLSSFRKVLNDFIEKGTGKHLKSEVKLPELISDFFNKLSDLEPVFFFDDCEKIPEELNGLFDLMLEQRKRGEKIGTVIMTRTKPNFYDVRDVMQGFVFEEELGPLNFEDVKEMLDEAENLEQIYEKTGGHPLYLELFKRYKGETIQMKDFVEKEIYSNLKDEEKNILKKLSVFWSPVGKETILEAEEADLIIDLKDNHLVEETKEGKISLHSILKDFFYEKVVGEDRKELHLSAARNLEKSSEKRELEILYHYEKSGDWEKSLEKLDDLIYYISDLNENTREELLNLFPEEELSEDKKGYYFEIVGDIYLEAEQWNKARDFYEKAKEADRETSELREKLGEAQMRLEKWKETIQSHKKALEKYKREDDKEGITREYLGLGIVHRRRKNYKKSEEYYKKADEIIKNNNLDNLKGVLYNNLGILYLYKHQYHKAEDNLLKALEEGGDRGISYENLSLIFEEMNDLEKAVDYIDKAISYYETDGRIDKVIDLLMKEAGLLTKLDKKETAIDKLKKGLNLEKRRGKGFWPFTSSDKMSSTQIQLHDRIADLSREIDWGQCLKNRKEAIKGLKERNEDKAKQILKYAFDLRDSGEKKEALRVLNNIEEKLSRNDISEGVTAARLEKARIFEDMGDYEKAENLLEEIIEDSEKRNDVKALKESNRLMNKVLKSMGRKKEAEKFKDKYEELGD